MGGCRPVGRFAARYTKPRFKTFAYPAAQRGRTRPCYRPALPYLLSPSLFAPVFQRRLLAKYQCLLTDRLSHATAFRLGASFQKLLLSRVLCQVPLEIFFVFLSRPGWPLVLYGCKALKGRTFPDESGFSISNYYLSYLFPCLLSSTYIGQAGVEPATSWSRTKRATNCATAR